MKANQNTTSTIAEKDAGLAQGTLLHPAKPSGDGSFVRGLAHGQRYPRQPVPPAKSWLHHIHHVAMIKRARGFDQISTRTRDIRGRDHGRIAPAYTEFSWKVLELE
jgi:hypothetical protein